MLLVDAELLEVVCATSVFEDGMLLVVVVVALSVVDNTRRLVVCAASVLDV